MPKKNICKTHLNSDWIRYFEDLLKLEQERFELEILIFFENCNYNWQEIDQQIDHLPKPLKKDLMIKIEKMKQNTRIKMAKSLHHIFLSGAAIVLVTALFMGLFLSRDMAIHFGAMGLMGLLLLAIAGSLWISNK